jgi:ribosomal protein S18 acetylase RimI-like enzyme
VQIRRFRAGDADAVYDVCLRTGNRGGDATGLVDRDLIGDVWAGPYLAYAPELAFVAADETGRVVGYVIGVRDTRAFEAECEVSWWPALRARHVDPTTPPTEWGLGDQLRYLVHHPPRAPEDVQEGRPAHLHLDLAPEAQGLGHGARLLDTFLDALRATGTPGVHLGVAPDNPRARRFWARGGFREVAEAPGVVFMGRSLDDT